MRYIGGKSNLLNDINNVITQRMINVNTVIDIFSGSGVVSSFLKRNGYNVIGNDIMYFSYVLSRGSTELNHTPAFANLAIADPIAFLNNLDIANTDINLEDCFIYQNYSVNYQIREAEERMEKAQYENALTCLVKAEKLQPEDTGIPYMQAQCYYELGEADRAAEILENVVFKRSMDEERKIQYFDFIITILAGQQNYERINELLMESGDTAVQTQFQHYMAMKPEFGYSTGNYEKVISLKITANTTGTIYYTTDGSEPQEHSVVYTAPIQLEPGEHRIKAVFVNDYGIRSETVENYYLIDVAIPEKPEVTPSSGDYQLPTLIEVITAEEGNIYYTTDGSEPDENSLLYTEPIDMPLGRTNYRFAVISEEGVMSEVVYRSYDFELQTQVTVKAAIDRVKKALMDQHILKDMQGNSFEIEGRYVYEYETLVEIPNLGYYYKLSESIVDSAGKQTQTGRLYAVEVYSGTPNRLVYDENGQMGIIPLNK